LKVSSISEDTLRDLLTRGDCLIDIFPFVARVRSDVSGLARDILLIYGEFELLPATSFADFHVDISLDKGIRQWISPQARFSFDGKRSFVPLPSGQAFPMLEWGLNWCVSAHAHQYLVIHAAVIEKNGLGIVLPAPPGSGKSTLCAGLVNRGWRLLSDELALYDFENNLIYGMARPINLKNISIEVIKAFAPNAVFTKSIPDTTKGTVALMRPPASGVARVREPVKPARIVLPKFSDGSESKLIWNGRAETFMLLAQESFNYDVHGLQGFKALSTLLDQCECYKFTYSKLDDAEKVFERMLTGSIQ
jgi:HprK-related kinase A